MKKFKYPLAIEGSEDDRKSLVPKLEELGYTFWCIHGWHNRPYLLTNFGSQASDFGPNQNSGGHIKVSASNPDLVLALAAMVDDDKFYKGEIVKSNLQADGQFTKGALYTIALDQQLYSHVLVTKDDEGDSGNGLHHSGWIKATKEEIINHFTKQEVSQQVSPSLVFECQSYNPNKKPMEKKIIGYKLKDDCKQYIPALDKISSCFSAGAHKKVLQQDCTFANDYRKAGVLDLWFEPVYEEDQFKVGDWVVYIEDDPYRTEEVVGFHYNGDLKLKGREDQHCRCNRYRKATPQEIEAAQKKIITLRCEGGTFEIEVSKKGIYYAPESKWLPPTIIRQFINDITHQDVSIGGYTFHPIVTAVDSGCKKRVPIEDWKKVLDAYDELNK